jgi:predicted permease
MLSKASLSVPAYIEYRDHLDAFESVAAGRNWSANLTGHGDPERLQGARVTANLLRTVGVAPALGRDFLPEEDSPGADRVVIISHGLWQRRFAGDPGLVGKTLTVNDETHTVIGILPAGFVFYRPVDLFKPIAFTPADMAPENHGYEFLVSFARLRPEASLDRARAGMDALAAGLRQKFYNKDWSVTITPLQEEMTGEIRPALLVLVAAVACVLLIACANVANLLLVRATERRGEIAVRAALGAGRGRLVRQLLTESVVLAAAGGAIGLLLAWWGIKLLMAAAPPEMADFILGGRRVGIDGTVLAFTLGISLLTGLGFGLAPALFAARGDVNEVLKESGSRVMGGSGQRLLDAFVVAQVAVALVLLVGAGLLIRSFVLIRAVDPGFRPDGVLTMRLTLPETRYVDDRRMAAFHDALLARLGALPGVSAAAVISNLPMGGDNWSASFDIEGQVVPDGQSSPHGDTHVVSADYFKAMGIPLVRGRFFEARDNGLADEAGAPPQVAIIDQVLADRYWPGQDPIGRRIALGFEGKPEAPLWREIVGVVGHVKKYGLDGRVKEQYYLPAAQAPARGTFVVLRAAVDPIGLVGPAREAVRGIDPDLPLFQVRTMDEVVDRTLVTRRFAMSLLALFAGVALVLATVGLYGVIAYSVGQRTREIGVRMALGAQPGDIAGMVVRRGMALALVGLLTGAAAALAVTRSIASLLFNVAPGDPVTFAVIAVLLAAIAGVAALIPALRAARVAPMAALRHE